MLLIRLLCCLLVPTWCCASTPSAVCVPGSTEDRLRGALWGLFAGDALAAPTHWYYGGAQQIRGDYGSLGITDYTKPRMHLAGSIMSKSNTTGGGRGSWGGRSASGRSVVGEVSGAGLFGCRNSALTLAVLHR